MNKELSIETPQTKTFSWTESLDCFSEKEFKHNWKNVADHIRYTLREDLINSTDYGKINIDAWVRKIDLESPDQSLTDYINMIRKREAKASE